METSKDTIVVHALHKSGSTFLFKYFQTLAKKLDLPFFSENLGHSYPESLKKEKCGIFSPSRLFPKELREGELHFYQLRHPLDILVSQYYSFGYMHAIKNDTQKKLREEIQSQSIDEYCIDAADKLYVRYSNIFDVIQKVDRTKYRLISYSNMVLDFAYWNNNILSHFDIEDEVKLDIYKKFYKEFEQIEELTEEEIVNANKSRHKRKMIPGDYLEKLEEPTIKILEKRFSGIIQIIEEMKRKDNSANNGGIHSQQDSLFKELMYSWNGKSWDTIRSPELASFAFDTHVAYGIEYGKDNENTVWKFEDNRWKYHSQGSIKSIVISKSGTLYGIQYDSKKEFDVAATFSEGKWKNLNAFETLQLVTQGENILVVRHDKKIFQLVDKKWMKLPGRDFDEIFVTEENSLVAKHSIRGISFVSILEDQKWKMIRGSKDFEAVFPKTSKDIYATRRNPVKAEGMLIYHWNGEMWSRVPGNKVKKFGMHNSKPIIIRDTPKHQGLLFHYKENEWTRLPNKDFKEVYSSKNEIILASK